VKQNDNGSLTVEKKVFTQEELEPFIYIDSLTKLPNFNYFKDVFERKWKSAIRKQDPLSLIVFDLDFLGLYNARYGFEAGNKVLKKIADKVKSLLNRPEDFLARYEGGTFLILLPETNTNGALFVAEKVRKEIEMMKIPHCESKISKYVTISFGVGTKTPFIWEDPFHFFKAVEQAMYTAKNIGRNQGLWNNVFEYDNENN